MAFKKISGIGGGNLIKLSSNAVKIGKANYKPYVFVNFQLLYDYFSAKHKKLKLGAMKLKTRPLS